MTHQYMEIKIKDLEKRIQALEQEPCEDAVSRKRLFDTSICEDIACSECSFNMCEDGQSGCLLMERISKLPSAKRKNDAILDYE